MKVNFFYNDKVVSGTVTDISENGMRIKTHIRVPCGSKIGIIIFSSDEVLNIPVTVKRLKFVTKRNTYKTLGTEILNPTISYLQFVNNLRIQYLL